MNNILRRMS
jgi:hypothetical protein